MGSTKRRYKDPFLRSRRFVWLRGRDAWNNFRLERLTMSTRKTLFGRKMFKVIDRIIVGG